MKGDLSLSTKSSLLSSSLLLGSVGLSRKPEESLTKKKPYALMTKKSDSTLKLGSFQGLLSTSSNLLQSNLLSTVAVTMKPSQSTTSTLLRPTPLATKLHEKKGDVKHMNLPSLTVSKVKLTSTFVPSRKTSVEESIKSTFLSSTTPLERTATKPVSFGQTPSAVKNKASPGKSKKKPLETEVNLSKVTAYDIPPPEYDLRWDTEDRKPIQIARFQNPEDSVALMIRENSLLDVNGKKVCACKKCKRGYGT